MKTDWMRRKYKRAMSFAGSLLFCIFRMLKNRICFPDKSCYNTSRVLKKRKEYWRNHYG